MVNKRPIVIIKSNRKKDGGGGEGQLYKGTQTIWAAGLASMTISALGNGRWKMQFAKHAYYGPLTPTNSYPIFFTIPPIVTNADGSLYKIPFPQGIFYPKISGEIGNANQGFYFRASDIARILTSDLNEAIYEIRALPDYYGLECIERGSSTPAMEWYSWEYEYDG